MSALRRLRRATAQRGGASVHASFEGLLAAVEDFGAAGQARCRCCGAVCLPDLRNRVHFEPTMRLRDVQGVHITFTCKRCFEVSSLN